MSTMVEQTLLPNGLRILTERLPGSRSVALGLLVDAGPQHDPVDQLGLAHLAEHALFCGTDSRDSLSLARMIDAAGGQMGGFVTRDYVCLHAHVLSDYAPYALELLGDVVLNSTLAEGPLEREQQTIVRELAGVADSPASTANQMLKQTAWPRHPLGRAVAGRADDVLRLTPRDVRTFLNTHYRPGSMTLAASGDVDHALFVSQAYDAFWRLQGAGPKLPALPCETVSGVAVAAADVAQAYFSLAFPMPAMNHPDRYALHIWNAMLGGGMSSRLFRRLREETGLVYSVSSELHGYRQAGLLVIEGAAAPEQLVSVMAESLGAIALFATGEQPFDDEELWTARRQVRGMTRLAGESTHTRMSRLLTQDFYFGRTIAEDELVTALDDVSADDLHTLQQSQIVPALEQPIAAVVGPHEWSERWNDSLQELVGAMSGWSESVEAFAAADE